MHVTQVPYEFLYYPIGQEATHFPSLVSDKPLGQAEQLHEFNVYDEH